MSISKITSGYNPVLDTVKKTPHGKFISWLGSSSGTQTESKPKAKTDFEKYKESVERSARKNFIQQEEYYDIETGEIKYRDIEPKKEPAPVKKSLWQRIKDWWNKDKTPVQNDSEIILKNFDASKLKAE